MLLLVLAAVLCAGCHRLGIRQDVDVEQARDLLTTAVGLAATGELDRLCTLSPSEASTCQDSVADRGELRPDEGPTILCEVPAPSEGPLRGGQVLVLEGTDASGTDYTTEFIVYDTGGEIGVLDPVWWSGLTVADYSGDTVTWRFDSTSTTCDRGGLPVSAG